jgi:hypothetical protein
MGFASDWLEKRAVFPEFITEAPHANTGIIVVVPAYNEPGIAVMLDSLLLCDKPACEVEVIIVVNAPSDAGSESLSNNEDCLKNIVSWKKHNPHCFFRLYSLNIVKPDFRDWGVGLARKTGMDEAVRRFNRIGSPEGVIVNLDADCLVAKNYLVSINNELLINSQRSACSIYFEHQKGNDDRLNEYITWYELHLRYFLQAIKFAGFPFAFHTVGSSIAVKSISYVKAGGMNRRQAGEDFYFIQKLVPAGGYFAHNTTVVYPSARASSRVPFGTGATISRLTAEKSAELLSYNVQAFTDLHCLFRSVESFFLSDDQDIESGYYKLPVSIKSFIDVTEWNEKVTELKGNTSNLQSFIKRFFGWFNMFKIVKFLNLVHQNTFNKVSISKSAGELLILLGYNYHSNDPAELLSFYRALEKNR